MPAGRFVNTSLTTIITWTRVIATLFIVMGIAFLVSAGSTYGDIPKLTRDLTPAMFFIIGCPTIGIGLVFWIASFFIPRAESPFGPTTKGVPIVASPATEPEEEVAVDPWGVSPGEDSEN